MIKSLSTSSRIILAVSTLSLVLGLYVSFLSPYLAENYASKIYEQALNKVSSIETSLSVVQKDLAERTSYLDTYIENVSLTRNAALAPLQTAKEMLEKATSAEKVSDKTSFVQSAERSIDEALTATTKAQAQLASIDAAYQNAGSELANVAAILPRNIAYVSGIIESNGFNRALQPAVNKNVEAETLLQAAVTASKTSINGKYDLVLVYTKAHEALVTTTDAVTYADGQITLYQSNEKRISSLVKSRQSFISHTDEPSMMLATLRMYHAQSAWNQVRNHANEIETAYQKSAEYLQTAVLKNSVSEQDFNNAVLLINQAETLFATATRKQNELVALRDQLERYRREWPQMKNDVAATIAYEKSNVTKYSAYSTTAVRDYNDGVDYFDSAIRYAENDDYVSAWSEANKAAQSVEGTGRRAENDYEDYLEEQSRAAAADTQNATTFTNSSTDNDGGGSLFGSDTSFDNSGSGGGDFGSDDGGDFGGDDTGGGDGGDF